MSPLRAIMRLVFYLLYHPFACSYDLVATTVSFGRWKTWVKAVIPFLEGKRILELGHGPGHLQRALLDRGLFAVGLDESRQMGTLARHNLRRRDNSQCDLTRGVAQNLPFTNQAFDSLVATFPTEYYFDPSTLAEVQRVLITNGLFVILPVALITGRGLLDKFLSWLFAVTGQAPTDPLEIVSQNLSKPFMSTGFDVTVQQVETKSSLLFIILAHKR